MDKVGHAAVKWTELLDATVYEPVLVTGWYVSDNSDDPEVEGRHPAGYVLNIDLNKKATKGRFGGKHVQVVLSEQELEDILNHVQRRD